MYQQILLLDLEYAIEKKIEQDLWNIGFKNYIDILQKLVKDKKVSKWHENMCKTTDRENDVCSYFSESETERISRAPKCVSWISQWILFDALGGDMCDIFV